MNYLFKLFIFMLLVLPLSGYAQFEIIYDLSTNTVSVNYTGCDICALGTAEAIQICECRDACDEVEPTQLDYDRYEDCKQRCYDDYGDDQDYLILCLDDCEDDYYKDIESCNNNYNPAPRARRVIIGCEYILIAAHDEIPLDPRNNVDNWIEHPEPIFFLCDKYT